VLATLDEDDILNPKETLRRQELGVDIDFMVKRLGGGLDNDSDDEDRNLRGSFAIELEVGEDEFIKSIIETPGESPGVPGAPGKR
jgi:hypothetical protein